MTAVTDPVTDSPPGASRGLVTDSIVGAAVGTVHAPAVLLAFRT